MRRIVLTFLFVFLVHILQSQWIVGPTLSGSWSNPSVSAATPTIAWAAANNSAPLIYRTTNGGINWTTISTTGLPSLNAYCIWGVDANTAYFGNGYGSASVFKTTNAGTNWTTLFSTGDSIGFFNGIEFSRTSPNFGICQSDPPNGAGNNFYIQYTTNGGTSWTLLSPPPPGYSGYVASQHSPFVVDNNFYGFAMNGAGICEITSNGGASWFTRSLGRSGFVSGLTFSTDKLNGIAAVSASGLSRTTNGGLNWTPISVGGIDGAFLSFCYWVPNTNLIYASGSGAGVKKSTNGGVVWSSMTSGTQTDIRHMDFILSGNTIYGYAICGNGVTLTLVDTQFYTPVKMNYFNYTSSENNVKLQWQTGWEMDNAGFDIERTNENNNWQKIAFVQGYGNKSTATSYIFIDKELNKGIYKYRLKQIDYNDNCEYFSLNSDVIISAPESYYLSQNYPNPFNPSTYINFKLPADGRVSLKVYDIRGSEVADMIDRNMPSGYYSIIFDGSKLPSGIYFYKLIAANYTETKKMLLVK